MESYNSNNTVSLSLSEDEIISRVKNGNVEYFSMIIKKYNQRLYRIAVSYGIHDDDCEEVLQLTYITAYTKLHQFRGDAKFSTWLTRILINECLMLKRKKQRSFRIDENDFVTIPAGDHLNPEKIYMNRERKEILENAIKQLPEKYRTIFMLREVEGMSIDETSEALQISNVNVKVRLHRAKAMLIDILKNITDLSNLFLFGNDRCDRVSNSVMGYIRSRKKDK